MEGNRGDKLTLVETRTRPDGYTSIGNKPKMSSRPGPLIKPWHASDQPGSCKQPMPSNSTDIKVEPAGLSP